MTIRYVGMSENACRRMAGHIQNRNKRHRDKDIWMESLLDAEIMPIIQVIERVETKQEAGKRERYWIKHYLSIGTPLTNVKYQRKTKRQRHQEVRRAIWRKEHLPPEEISAHIERVKSLIEKAGWIPYQRKKQPSLYAYHVKPGDPNHPYMIYIAALSKLGNIGEEEVKKKLSVI